MAITIRNAIAHRFEKERQALGTPTLAQDVLEDSELLVLLAQQIHESYSRKTAKSYGEFEADRQNFPTPANLHSHFIAEQVGFVAMTALLMATLVHEANTTASNLSTGGTVLFLDVETDGRQYLIITILSTKAGARFNSDMKLVDGEHLDVDAMRYAGRVDIQRWRDSEDKHVSFLRGASQDVSAYFKNFLGCSAPVSALSDTQAVVDSIDGFLDQSEMDRNARSAMRDRAYEYLDGKRKSKQAFSLAALANAMDPDAPEVINEFFVNTDADLSDGYVPHATALRTLVRVNAKSRRWELRVERPALSSGEVTVDLDAGTVTIANVDEEILSKLKRAAR